MLNIRPEHIGRKPLKGPRSGRSSGAGKGDNRRPEAKPDLYRDNFDKIDWTRK
jgi:hypothetical protein